MKVGAAALLWVMVARLICCFWTFLWEEQYVQLLAESLLMVETRYQNIVWDRRSVNTPVSPATQEILVIWVELQLLLFIIRRWVLAAAPHDFLFSSIFTLETRKQIAQKQLV